MKNPEKIKDIIVNSANLPSLPHVLVDLLDACNKGKNLDNLSEIVSKDPSLAARMMTLVNSAYMGVGKPVNSLDEAVIYLGLDTVKNIAVSASVLAAFKPALGKMPFDMNRFWHHSFLCAVCAREIALAVGHGSPEEAFLGGLLHDIGKLVIWMNVGSLVPESEREAFTKERLDGEDRTLILEKELDLTHEEIGASLVRKWNLGSLLADSVYYHHESLERIEGSFSLVRIVYLADLIASEKNDEALSAAGLLFDLGEGPLGEIRDGSAAKAGEVAKSFGMTLESPLKVKAAGKGEAEASRKRIAREVREITLMHGTLENLLKAESLDEILSVVEKSMQVLFEIHHLRIFLHDGERDVLKGSSGLRADGEDLVIPCGNRKNLAARAFEYQTPLDSFGILAKYERNIGDDQLIRLIGNDGILALPMNAGSSRVGVIVAGVSRSMMKFLSKKTTMLRSFAGHAAISVHVEKIKLSQARLVQMERMDASSTVIRKVIHEVNNPLSIIKNYLQILGLKLPEKHPAQDELLIIRDEIERASMTMRQLTSFSNPVSGERYPLEINRLIRDLLKIITPSMLTPKKIVAHTDLDDRIGEVVTVKNQLIQVLMNLIKNAAEAMESGGNIYIATGLEETESLGDGGKNEKRLLIEIRDDGPGIPSKVLNAAFEPFMTTKGKNHSGLGLSIVHGSVRDLGGSINCESREGGTVFTVKLPMAAGEKP